MDILLKFIAVDVSDEAAIAESPSLLALSSPDAHKQLKLAVLVSQLAFIMQLHVLPCHICQSNFLLYLFLFFLYHGCLVDIHCGGHLRGSSNWQIAIFVGAFFTDHLPAVNTHHYHTGTHPHTATPCFAMLQGSRGGITVIFSGDVASIPFVISGGIKIKRYHGCLGLSTNSHGIGEATTMAMVVAQWGCG